MIYVIDNGKSYSDHTFHFVDAGTLPAELFERLLEVFAELEAPYPSRPSIVAAADRLDWRTPGTQMLAADYFGSERFWAALYEDPTMQDSLPTRRQALVLRAALPHLEPDWARMIGVSHNSIARAGIEQVKSKIEALTAHPIIPTLED